MRRILPRWKGAADELELYVAMYLISNTIMMFVIWKYMGVFFERLRTPPVVAVLSYLFYLFSTSFVFIALGIPLVGMLVSVAGYFIIALNYEAPMMKRVAASLCGYIFMLTIDVMVNLIIGTPSASILFDSGFIEDFGIIAVGLTSYLMVVLLTNFKNIKGNNTVSSIFWVSALGVPVLSVFMTIIALSSEHLSQTIVVSAVAVVMTVNLLTFYLFDTLSASITDKLKAMLHAQEKKYYFTQCQLMQDSSMRMKSFKHDIKNHLAALKEYAKQSGNESIVEYLDKLLGDVGAREIYCETGNIAFDSIINHKMRVATENGIKPEVVVAIPPVLNVEVADVVTILGNLLDNAINAAAKTQAKILRLKVEWSRGGLLISQENSYDGRVMYEKGELASLAGGEGRGFGLKNIKNSVEKYNGFVKISHTEDMFCCGVLLYTESLARR